MSFRHIYDKFMFLRFAAQGCCSYRQAHVKIRVQQTLIINIIIKWIKIQFKLNLKNFSYIIGITPLTAAIIIITLYHM